MIRQVPILFLVLLAHSSIAQQVLHFTRTSGFDHGTREVSFEMFASIGDEIGLQVTDDSTGDAFSSLDDLSQFDVIVFANTSGNAILTATQRANFEQWVAQGGHVMGIHAATDTYRHSSANGNDTGAWDFYAELIGGSEQVDPHHVSGTPLYAMSHVLAHPSVNNLPDPWQKEEEYYYWENGYLGSMITPVLEVEETIGPNGQVNSYDAPRPVSWYRVTDIGRVFYTALGHAASSYTSDTLFRTHIRDALLWLMEGPASIEDHHLPRLRIVTDPSHHRIHLLVPCIPDQIEILDLQGRSLHRMEVRTQEVVVDLPDPHGIYFVRSQNCGSLKFIR